MTTPLTDQEQFQCLNMLDLLSDLFTASDKEIFTRAELLIALDQIRSNEELFDPLTVVAQQIATKEIDGQC